jgi:MFS family permease
MAGAFGAAPIANSGGVIADCFPARHRGLAMSVFAAAPFLGPSIGPAAAGFLGEFAGWRWVMGFMAIFSGVAAALSAFLMPETYAPYLLRQRAATLSKITSKVYQSKVDIDRGRVTISDALRTALTRPWILLVREPIVLIMSTYMAIIYGTLYLLFAAYPIVYIEQRHWSQGISGLAFIAVLIGMLAAVSYSIFVENPRYQRVADKHRGHAPPEARLPPAMLGGVLLPIGLFWFAWTNSPDLPWAASMAAGVPFGMGMVLVFLAILNYLIDSYTIFAASVLAANSVLRSLFGAVFPLFTTYMYNSLGIHWASSVPAFLALACVPFPYLFYKYGPAVRRRCKFATEAELFVKQLRGEPVEAVMKPEDVAEDETALREIDQQWVEEEVDHETEEQMRQDEVSPIDEQSEERPRFVRIRSGRLPRIPHADLEWDDNPWVIDRVNTRESFGEDFLSRHGSRASRHSARLPSRHGSRISRHSIRLPSRHGSRVSKYSWQGTIDESSGS